MRTIADKVSLKVHTVSLKVHTVTANMVVDRTEVVLIWTVLTLICYGLRKVMELALRTWREERDARPQGRNRPIRGRNNQPRHTGHGRMRSRHREEGRLPPRDTSPFIVNLAHETGRNQVWEELLREFFNERNQ